MCVVVIVGALVVAWLPNAQVVNAPADANLAITDPDPYYGDKTFLDSAPGTGDLSDFYAAGTGRRLFTGEEQDQLEATAFALAPLVTGGIVKQILKNADARVAQWGVRGTIAAAEQAAKRKLPILPGLFKYGSGMKVIDGYQRHHLWPKGLGGPEDGWAIYVKTTGDQNWHTAEGGLHTWINWQLIQKYGFADYSELKEWALQNPNQLLSDLRDIYSDIEVHFPY